MSTLYELNAQYEAAIARAESLALENDGDIPESLAEELDKLELDRNQKIENCVAWMKQEEALAQMCYDESAKLQNRGARHDHRADWMKEYLACTIGAGNKWEGRTGRVSWRDSTSVSVTSIDILPDEYVRVVPEKREADKKAIGDALKLGKAIEGCELVKKQNIQIK